MMQKKSDDAVSPVIGVMLMLVITVVIAGVVSAFGTGLVGNTEAAPSVVLDVEIINYDKALDGSKFGDDLCGPDFRITHLSGDTLDTGDIELRFSWTDSTGNKHRSSYSADSFTPSTQPMFLEMYMLPNMQLTGMVNNLNGIPFGDVELEPGFTIKTCVESLGNILTGDVELKGSKFMDQIFNNGDVLANDPLTQEGIMQYLEKGTKVDVTILHIPSNQIIYDKAVIVQ